MYVCTMLSVKKQFVALVIACSEYPPFSSSTVSLREWNGIIRWRLILLTEEFQYF